MRGYFFKTPQWLQRFDRDVIWSMAPGSKEIYLTFDDGPTPKVTDYVLNQLAEYSAKASFFCLGKQIATCREDFNKIIESGHCVGNHTYNHLNGWKTKNSIYLRDIELFDAIHLSKFFRPPYGKMWPTQKQKVTQKVVLWSHMSGDFDQQLNISKSLKSLLNAKDGSIIVFHDNLKSFQNLKALLPKILYHFSKAGYTFKSLEHAID